MVRGHTPNRRFVHTGFSTAFGDDDVGDDEDEEADREELRHMQEQRISEHFDDVSGGRGSVDAAGVERLLDKLQASQRSRQVILKCVADSSNVSLEEFIELWFSS
ncbi:unnamed protein product [Symbiodinium microadriaticum]|nr:unnamed protein product [Symbiodinium microadriaticum]